MYPNGMVGSASSARPPMKSKDPISVESSARAEGKSRPIARPTSTSATSRRCSAWRLQCVARRIRLPTEAARNPKANE
jgi:hypothetical protein